MAFDPDAFLAAAAPPPRRAFNPAGGIDYDPTRPAAADDSPGMLESAARGAAQGATFGFADEIAGAVESAFTDKTYKQARDESRANFARAKDENPWSFGLGEIAGSVATGVATGGAAGVAGKAGLKGVAALAGAEGALTGVGTSEAESAGGIAKDAAVGGVLGAALGGAAHKAFGKFAASAGERHARHIAEDVTDGANMTMKKRFAQVAELAPEVFDDDKTLRRALRADPAEAADMVKDRLGKLGAETKPLYSAVDQKFRPLTVGEVVAPLSTELRKAQLEPGKEAYATALERIRDNFVAAQARKVDDPKNLGRMKVPTVEVRKWVSNLLAEADTTMGSIAETERWRLKSQLHDLADGVLKSHLQRAGAAGAGDEVAKLQGLNRKITVLVKAEEALQNRAVKESVGHRGFRDTIRDVGLPGVAGAIGAGADVVTGGLAFAGTKAMQVAAKATNRAATTALAKLAKAAQAGDASKKLVLEALGAGVPVATVQGLLASGRNSPELFKEIGVSAAELVSVDE